MGSKDPRVDAYIAAAAGFAQPILMHLREAVHAGCPMVVETMRWGLPHFEYRGFVCSMAALRAHCTFVLAPRGAKGARNADDVADRRRLERIRRLADLPSAAALKARIRAAVTPSSPAKEIPCAPASA
jgi:hypothetical protein